MLFYLILKNKIDKIKKYKIYKRASCAVIN